LAQVLRSLPVVEDERLIVGHASFDDAGVYRLTDDIALVQTIDFFPPLVDDPFVFGQVAAANSLSDVYAMGGTPLTALSLVCFPNTELPLSVLGEILRGGGEKCKEAQCTLVGGHSVRDPEIKFGLAVTGTIHPKKVTANDGAKAGDRLFLTKTLGMGAITTAYRKNILPEDAMLRACAQMATLNRLGAEAMRAAGIPEAVHAATDVTGFGLLGHARNIAAASHVSLVFESAKLPLFENVLELTAQKHSTGAYKQNQFLLEGLVDLPESFDERLHRVIYDAETSGGLLMAVAPDKGEVLARELASRGVAFAEVGHVAEPTGKLLRVV
jgi:selenide, water dikinase